MSAEVEISDPEQVPVQEVEPENDVAGTAEPGEDQIADEQEELLPESVEPTQDSDVAHHQSKEDQDPAHYASLTEVTKRVHDQLGSLDLLTVENFEQVLEKFRGVFDEALDVSEKHAQAYIAQASAIEEALTALSEYNRKALEQLSKLTVDAVKKLDDPSFFADKDRLKAGEMLIERAKMLVTTAEKQVEYSRQIGAVAKPLTSWRLDSSKAVWEANNALKLAEQKFLEVKEKAAYTNAQAQLPLKPTNEISEASEENVADSKFNPAQPPAASASTPDHTLEALPKSSHSGQFDKSAMSDRQDSKDSLDPVNNPRQPIKYWPKHVYNDINGDVICYIRAPVDCLRRKESISCSFGDPYGAWPLIPGHSEIIGRHVSIQPTADRKNVILPNEPWIIGIPHTYGKVASKEAVLYAIEAGPKGVLALEEDPKKVKQTDLVSWKDLHTTDVVVDGAHYLEARLTRLTTITFAPFARLRRDRAEIGRKGGQLMSMGDPRIMLGVPPEAIRATVPFTMQVQHLDRHHLPTLIEQNEIIMKEFISCSPLIYLTCTKKLLFKPVSISMPILDLEAPMTLSAAIASADRVSFEKHADPSNNTGDDASVSTVTKTSGMTHYDNFQKSLILPQLLAGSRTDVYELVLMQKSEKPEEQWAPVTDAERINVAAEVVTFSLNKIESCKLMVLKLRRRVDTEILSQCAATLEKSLSQHMIYFALRQNQRKPEQLCLLLAMKDPMEGALQQLSDEGYKDGDKPYGPVFLTENQQLDISLKSNVRLTGNSRKAGHESLGCLKITYNSAVVNRHKFQVKVIDPSAQLGLDHYRGILDIYCMRNILVATTFERRPSALPPRGSLVQRMSLVTQKPKRNRFRMITEQTHLARMVIKLPKQPTQAMPSRKLPDFEFESKDAITPKYLKELASKLPGDMWRRLGLALEMPRSRLQAINGKTVGCDDGPAHAMLLSWIKKLPISADRCSILYRALQNIGRPELARELRSSTDGYMDADEVE